MHKSQSLFNLTIALHVSGVTITHLHEHKLNCLISDMLHKAILLYRFVAEISIACVMLFILVLV
jgi:hypothetical protein